MATSFPSGLSPLDVKLHEVRDALAAGADEIDTVIDRGAFLAGRYAKVADDISTCVALEEHRKERARTIGINALVFPAPEDRAVRTKDGLKVTRAGSLWKPSVMSGQFQRAAKRAGVPMHFHALRHSTASLLLAAGAPMKVISAD